MNNYRKHAEIEFKAAGWDLKDEMQKLMCDQVCELLDLFYKHGHSESTAPCAVNLFSKLAMFELIAPLTGEEWEWNEVFPGVFQNNRCSHVFKQADRFDGQAYDIEGRIFRDPNESCWTNSDSFVPIEFPYTPKREYIDREAS